MLADRFLEAATQSRVGTTEGLWRSACHASYYAVFHAVGEAGEELLFQDPAAALLARRAVTHDSLLSRSRHYQTAQPANPSWDPTKWSSGRSPTVPSVELVRLADSVVALQSARLDADYNPTVQVGQGTASVMASKARGGVETVRALTASSDSAFLDFLRWLFFPSKLR